MLGVIKQNVNTPEANAVYQAALLDDLPREVCDISRLMCHKNAIKDGQMMPVGSVEFCREAFRVSGIREPEPLDYPVELRPYLKRHISQCPIGTFHSVRPMFVKPVTTKKFDSILKIGAFTDSSLESLGCTVDERIWVSDIICLEVEARYYIQGGQVVGMSRYDDLPDDKPMPDFNIIKQAIVDLGCTHPYCLDFGVTMEGETVLVEASDAWAIGLYGRALTPKQYFYFLAERWMDIHQKSTANS